MPRGLPVPLPRLLSLLPRDGVGASVYQSRWAGKGLPVPTSAATLDDTCRWDVKKVKLQVKDGKHVGGRAWGVLHWKGKRVTPADKEYEPIRSGLKYLWQASTPPPLLASPPRPASSPAAAAAAAAAEQ